MIILDEPQDVENFICLDGNEAFEVSKHIPPMYKAGGCLYFRKSKKLIKTLKKLNIEYFDGKE